MPRVSSARRGKACLSQSRDGLSMRVADDCTFVMSFFEKYFGVAIFVGLGVLYVPLTLFVGNLDSLMADASLLGIPVLVVMALALPLISLVRLHETLNLVLAGLGLSVFICDQFLRGNYRLLDGYNGVAEQNLTLVALNAIAYACIPIALVFFGDKIRLFLKQTAPIILMTVLAGYIGVVGYSVFTSTSDHPANDGDVRDTSISEKPNVYLIVLDALDGKSLNQTLRETTDNRDFFGFTSFTQTTANYLYTNYSFASFLSGTTIQRSPNEELPSRDGPIGKSAGLSSLLKQNGYRISAYTQSRFLNGNEDVAVTDSEAYAEATSISGFYVDFVTSWTMRSLPSVNLNFSETIRNSVGRLSQLVAGISDEKSFLPTSIKDGLQPYTGVRILEKATSDEDTRGGHGEFVLVHAIIPHGPYRIAADCTYREQVTSQKEQEACAMSLAGQFLNKLRELGRYDQSFIAIFGDHGSGWESVAKKRGDTSPVEDLKKFSIAQLQSRARPAMMIKPADTSRSNNPLQFVSTEAQLIDIFPTIVEDLGLEIRPMYELDGRSLFQTHQTRREKYFTYFRPTLQQIPQPAYDIDLHYDEVADHYRLGDTHDFFFNKITDCDRSLSFKDKELVARGLSGIEKFGRWSKSSTVEIPIQARNNCNPVGLKFLLRAFVTDKHPIQRATVSVNGVPIGRIEIKKGEKSPKQIFIDLPELDTRRLKIRFDIETSIAPKALGLSKDHRNLGLGFIALELVSG